MDTLENNGAGRSGHSKRIENLGIPKKKIPDSKMWEKKSHRDDRYISSDDSCMRYCERVTKTLEYFTLGAPGG